ncbi:restriction endonuclease subunit S [Frisingicoccus sp.]|uniref:restriction endonuclease subunit S n=1 Tax=Frisingicoccus sp. TaxID=1918627 RepID=UPI003AB75DC2
MKLSDREWKPYRLSALGKVESGRDIYAMERIDGNIPYITSGSQNNGIGYFVSNKNNTLDKGYIAFNRNGAVGIAFYHPYWSVMGNDCRKIHLSKADENIYVGLFVATAISMQSKSFSYSRKLGTARANKLQIMLPVTDDGEPDYQFMEDYVRELMTVKRKQYRNYVEKRLAELGLDVNIPGGGYKDLLKSRNWKEFNINDIFVVGHGFYNKKPPMYEDGNFPFIGASGENNGVTGFTTVKDVESNSKIGYGPNESLDRKIFKRGHLCVVNNGSAIGYTYYQPNEFTCTHDVNPLWLRNREMNLYLGLFLSQMIKNQGVCFAYARKWRPSRMINSQFMLPVTCDGEPDYEFMEDFGRKMMANKYFQYLAFLAMSDTIEATQN